MAGYFGCPAKREFNPGNSLSHRKTGAGEKATVQMAAFLQDALPTRLPLLPRLAGCATIFPEMIRQTPAVVAVMPERAAAAQ